MKIDTEYLQRCIKALDMAYEDLANHTLSLIKQFIIDANRLVSVIENNDT